VEGMLCGLADGVEALRAEGVEVGRVLLIGGAARSASVRAVAAGLFGVPVEVPEPAEYVARGAARQAAWVLAGSAEPPDWPVPGESLPPAPAPAEIRERYRSLRDAAHPVLNG
jgi:xylulokinase